MNPFMGQGAQNAALDGVALAETLCNSRLHEVNQFDVGEAFTKFRKPEVDAISKLAIGQCDHVLGENVDDFITTMNDPKSINMDDLVGYYKWKKGVANVQQATPQTPIPASNSFRQVQRAQSVPQPMGVQPAQSNVPTNSDDNFMNAIVNSDNNTNIL